MLLDSAMMSASVMGVTGCGWESWIVKPSISRVAGTAKTSSSATAPVSSAAAAVMTLFTEPGSHRSVTGRFRYVAGSKSDSRFGSNHG